MKTQTQHLTELAVLSTADLSSATGGSTPVVFDTAGADAFKQFLDRQSGVSGNDPGRSVARRVPGTTDQWTVEGPRQDASGGVIKNGPRINPASHRTTFGF